MIIGIDINPLIKQPAGKASFLKNIINSLSDIDSVNKYYLYAYDYIELELKDNFKIKIIKGKVNFFWELKCFFVSKFIDRINVYFSAKSFWGPILHTKSVISIHDVGPLKYPFAYKPSTINIYKRMLKLAIRRVDKIISPSSYTKSFLVNKFKVKKEKIKVITEAPPGWTKLSVDNEDIDRVISRYKLFDKYILFVGTIEPRKNLENLIKAFKIFVDKTQSDIGLVIVGKRGYLHENLNKLVIDLQLSHKIIFTGHIPEVDMKPIYSKALAFVFPSIHEGFGLSILEAFACNLPVLCSKKGAIYETVGNACLEINPTNIEDIAEKINLITRDNDLREDLISRGRKRMKLFDWRLSSKKLLGVLRKI